MSFCRIPVTAEAHRIVDQLAVDVAVQEQRKRRRRREDLAAFKATLGRALGDLATTLVKGRGHCRSWPKGSYYYRQPHVLAPYRQALAVYHGLQRLGYVKTERRGFYDKGARRGECETVKPTGALHERLKQAGVMDDVGLHWAFDPDVKLAARLEPLIVVRRKRKQPDGTRAPADIIPGLEFTDEGQRLLRQMELRNQFIEAQHVEGAQLIGWNRIFVEELAQGGRMYALPRGETSYQQMSKIERAKLRINGEPVSEIDLTAASLYLALARRGVSLVERMQALEIADPYALPDTGWRKIIKHYWTVCGGSEEHPSRWPKETRAKLGGDRLPKIAEVRAVFLQAYPELTDVRGIGWPQVQRLESEAIGMAMDGLRAQAVPALPVHDSLIVPGGATELAKWYMEQACTEVAGFRPVEPKVTFGGDNRGEMAGGGVEGVAGRLPIQGAMVLVAMARPEVLPPQP